jgi:hypothetical protein
VATNRSPACPDCGSPTVPSTTVHTIRIGGSEDQPTRPVVEAIVKIEIPVNVCVRPQCGQMLMGSEANKMVENCMQSVIENAKPKI